VPVAFFLFKGGQAMKKTSIFFVFFLGMGLTLLGCKKSEEEEAPVTLQETRTESKDAMEMGSPSSPQQAKESTMVVSVNDAVITVSDVDRATNILLAQHRNQIPPDRVAEARTALREQAVENLINQSLLLGEAEKQGIQPEQKVLDARYAEVSGRFSSPEEFQSAMTSMGLSKEAFRDQIKQDLKIESLLDGQLKEVKKVTEEDVSVFYRDHPESFRSGEQVRASHILMRVEATATEEDRSQKRLELAGLKGQIEKGADFGQLASDHSDCPSKARGGDLGYFERGKMVKPFEDAAFEMKVGDVSEIVETQFGYHLIKVTDHQDPKTAPFEEVKAQIENLLNRQARDKVVSEYLAQLRGAAKITYAEAPQP
jgi:peptidyl-prolyl cis-trans isomerase C